MNRTAGRLTLMLAALALLAGCEATRFERAPLAASEPCDRALVGSWQDEPDAVGEVTRLQVSADCRLVVTMIHEGKSNSTDPVRLSTARLDDRDFAWVSARWAHPEELRRTPQHLQSQTAKSPSTAISAARTSTSQPAIPPAPSPTASTP